MRALRNLVLLLAGCSLASAQTAQEKAWAILDSGAKEKSADKRMKAVRVLGLVPREPRATGLAQGALDDARPEVRAAAATALGQMGATAAIPALKRTLRDADTSVVLAAAASLLKLKDRSAYGVYYTVLTGQHKRGQALMAAQTKMFKDPRRMAQFGFEQGIGFVPFAGMGYSAVKALAKDDVSPIRAAAAKVLAADPDPRSGEALVGAAGDKSWLVRAAALDAIAQRGDPRLMSGIEPELNDVKDIVQYTAAAAIVHLSGIVAKSGKR